MISGGENLTDDNLEESSGATTFDLRQAADEAMAMYEQNGITPLDIDQNSDLLTFEENMCLIFEVIGSARILTIDIDQDVVIGRSDSTDNFSAGLDLTDYGAYQLGLSRKHARLRRSGQQLELEDLGSRNGTYINEQRLNAHVPYVVRNGDMVRFGNMRVNLRFAQKA